MSSFLDPIFIASVTRTFFLIPYFLLIIVVAFYIPGNLLLGKKIQELLPSQFSKIVVSIAIGLVLFAYQGIIFGYLHTRYLTYLYVICALTIWIKSYVPSQKVQKVKIKFDRFWFLLLGFVILGIFGQNQQFFITAHESLDGIRGFTASLDDSFWHTSLVESLVRTFPPIEPGMSGVVVRNYHYLSDLVVADVVRVFHLPLFPAQYFFMGFFISGLLGSLAYVLGKQLNFGKIGLFIIVYLQYFSSDIIYLTTFVTQGIFRFTIHPLEDGTMLLENIPRAFSYVVLMLGLILLRLWLENFSKRLGFVIVLIFGSLIGFKVHTGAMALFSIGILCLYLLATRRVKNLYLLVSFGIAFLLYFPVNAQAGGALFVPFEMTSRNFAVQNGLGLVRLELARQVYAIHHNWLQALRMDLSMLVLYIVSQFGIKIIGIIPFNRTITSLHFPFWLFLISGALFSFTFGALFIQPVAPADIFNSFLAGGFFMMIMAVANINNFFKGKNIILKVVLFLILFSVTLPRFIYKTATVGMYIRDSLPIIQREELQAMQFLNVKNDKSTILVFNKGHWDSHYSFVSIFTQSNTFLSGQVILGRHGIDTTHRQRIVDEVLNSRDANRITMLLGQNSISYLYFYGPYNLQLNPDILGLKKVFKNNSIEIYKFQ